MADSDWTEYSGSLNTSTVDRGVTTGITPPNGGGNFVFGMNSLVVATGAVAYFPNQVNFAPCAKGMSVYGAIIRLTSGGTTGFAPFFIVGAQGNAVTDNAYLFGLSDNDPYHIVLKKGTISGGLDDLAPDAPNNGIMLRSTASYSQNTWHHLRIDMSVNLNGDVLFQCYESDLTAHAVTAPSWTLIAGMENFVDDTLSINTGSAPYTSGRAGLGGYFEDVTRRCAFDQYVLLRQL